MTNDIKNNISKLLNKVIYINKQLNEKKGKEMKVSNVAMTTDFAGESKSTDEIRETLKQIVEAGSRIFTGVMNGMVIIHIRKKRCIKLGTG